MSNTDLQDLLTLVEHSLAIEENKAIVKDPVKLRATIHKLAEASALDTGVRQGMARYIVRLTAPAMGVYLASIHNLYTARGRGEIPLTFTVPAINLRILSFDAARAVFHAANRINASAFIFEIARSEMGYTDQRPVEYVTNVLAAAIAEGFTGPVFIQGDHFQVSAKRFAIDPEAEIKALRDLIQEAIQAGFFNIDIDTSTLVDLTKTTIPEQQTLNTSLSATFTAYIRSLEPAGITISVGGEIGEVGGHNSTEEELRAYMDGYYAELAKQSSGALGISKISIQTGTSHGGVVLPDGTIAKVSVDFNTLRNLSRIARKDYGMGGTVQHGASTLPEDAFGKFVESEAVEVHLATNFQNIFFDRIPVDLRDQMYDYMDEKNASERKPDMTDEQFYYKTRKNVIGPFKKQTWNMPMDKKAAISQAWEEQFNKLFKILGLADTRSYVDQAIRPVIIQPNMHFYLGAAAVEGDISDLAD